MAWSMPTGGPWNPGIAMAPDMNMGTYTPDQWAAMQQQNWQQWTQWQQQYAQWQSQYGEKYAEQMQAMQAMGAMPPLPPASTAPPPAPPPPDQPPPPPHENNQPLFAKPPAPSEPAPVPPPSGNQPRNVNTGNYSNINTQSGNNSNWSYPPETTQQQTSINAEALKKLAEEERLFDIQFQKWEEEIQKWKKENGNHPDKQAYKEYEEKFEACRAQLMERRQQMKLKRARLMGSASQQPENTNTTQTGNVSSAVPPAPKNLGNDNFPNMQAPPQPLSNNNYPNMQTPPKPFGNSNYQNIQAPPKLLGNNNYPNMQTPQKPLGNNNYQNIQPPQKPMGNNNYANMPPPQKPLGNNNYPNMPPPQQHLGNNNYPNMQTPQKPLGNNNYPNMQTPQKPLGNNNYPNMQTQQFKNNAPTNYQDQSNQNKQYNASQTGYNRGNNKNIDLQDRYESYQNSDDNNYPDMTANFSAPDNETFLPKTGSTKGIPGLDLVHEGEKHALNKQDVIDITEEVNDDQLTQPQGHQQPQGPDYSKISKRINNILGDEKIMNILSMVCGQQTQEEETSNAPNVTNQSAQYGGNHNNPPYNQGMRNQNYNNQQYDNRQNTPYNRQGQNYQGQNQEVGKYAPPNRMYNERQDEMSQDQYGYNRNPHFGDHEVSPSYDNGPPPLRPAAPVRPNIPAGRPPPRPLMQEPPSQQNANDYHPILHERRPLRENFTNPIVNPPTRPKWMDEPLFTPSIIVEYEHKPLRLKAREFIEPVHMFDYNHKSKDGDNNKKKDFEKEADELFSRKPRRSEKDSDYSSNRFSRDHYSRDYERRAPREEIREDFRSRPPRDSFDDRRRPDTRFDDRRRDDSDKYSRRDDHYRERDRDFHRDTGRDVRRETSRQRSRSHERDTRKRAPSKESDTSVHSLAKKPKENDLMNKPEQSKHIVMIDDLLESPGREMRPTKIVIILRGPPGSGKSYLAKLIRDREAEHGGTVRIMSIDDYFMQEGEVEEKDPTTGKMIKKPTLKYEYDEKSEATYLNSLKRAFKRSMTDGYFSFLIYDAVNENLKGYADIWNYARQNGFQVYVCTMELDPQICHKRNIHNRKLDDIEVICARFMPTPAHHIQLEATTLLQNAAITDVHMEDADDVVIMEDAEEPEVESVFTSKWEKMDDAAQLARLDGISRPLRPSQLSMEDYLQLDDWKPTTAKPGKKTVRWADIEERRQQEKMRAIGFVVGQTDWNRMTDPTMGSSALTQTKYIERVRRN